MNEPFQPMTFRTTRWKQLIFPQVLIIDEAHVLTRRRKFPFFWIIKEESIPLRSVASIQILKGLFFSNVVIENSGGPFPIQIPGIPNKKALQIRQAIETHIPQQRAHVVSDKTPEQPGVEKTIFTQDARDDKQEYKPYTSNPKNSRTVSRKTKAVVIEPWEKSWDGSTFDPLESQTADAKMSSPVRIPKDFELPTIEEALYNSDKKKASKPGWMDDLIKPPRRMDK